jgi:hypothetical protein
MFRRNLVCFGNALKQDHDLAKEFTKRELRLAQQVIERTALEIRLQPS